MVPVIIMILGLTISVCVASVFINGTLTKIAEVLYAIYCVLQEINGKIEEKEDLEKVKEK